MVTKQRVSVRVVAASALVAVALLPGSRSRCARNRVGLSTILEESL